MSAHLVVASLVSDSNDRKLKILDLGPVYQVSKIQDGRMKGTKRRNGRCH